MGARGAPPATDAMELDDAAEPPRLTWAEGFSAFPALAQPGAPVPLEFPNPEDTFVAYLFYALPEQLFRHPLPYALGGPVRQQRLVYLPKLADFVVEHKTTLLGEVWDNHKRRMEIRGTAERMHDLPPEVRGD